MGAGINPYPFAALGFLPRLPILLVPLAPDSRGTTPSWDWGLVLGFGYPPLGKIAGNRRYGPMSVFHVPRLVSDPIEVVTSCAVSCASGFSWRRLP